MKKEQLIKLGFTEEIAEKITEIFKEELKGFIPKSRFDQVNESKKELENQLALLHKQVEKLNSFRLNNEEFEMIVSDLWEIHTRMKREQEIKLKEFIIRLAVRTKLSSNHYAELLLGKVDLSGITIEDNGKVEGIDKELIRLKEAYPQLFT